MNIHAEVVAAPKSKNDGIAMMLAADAVKQNCFTLGLNPESGRFDTADGIVLAVSHREGYEAPMMSIASGPMFIARDMNEHHGQKLGFIHHSVLGHYAVLSAELFTIHPKGEGKRPFEVLRRPAERPDYAIVKVDLVLPGFDGMKNHDKVRTLSGLAAENVLIRYRGMHGGRYNDEAVVRLEEGQSVTALLSDGSSYRYTYEGGELVERPATAMEYLEMRIDDALTQVYLAGQVGDEEKRQRQTSFVLHAMANLLGFDTMDQSLMMRLMSDFFRKLTEAQVGIVQRKLYAILSQKAPILRPMIYGEDADSRPNVTTLRKVFKDFGPGTSPLRGKPKTEEEKFLDRKKREENKAKRAAENRARATGGNGKGDGNGGGKKDKKKQKN